MEEKVESLENEQERLKVLTEPVRAIVEIPMENLPDSDSRWDKVSEASACLGMIADELRGRHDHTIKGFYTLGRVTISHELWALALDGADALIKAHNHPDISAGWSLEKQHKEHLGEVRRTRRQILSREP